MSENKPFEIRISANDNQSPLRGELFAEGGVREITIENLAVVLPFLEDIAKSVVLSGDEKKAVSMLVDYATGDLEDTRSPQDVVALMREINAIIALVTAHEGDKVSRDEVVRFVALVRGLRQELLRSPVS